MMWLTVALGGAIGAVCRYGLTLILPPISTGFPWATFAANIAGAILMGVLYVIIVEKGIIPMNLRPLLMVGFLGALTTFSTFVLDAWLLWEMGRAVNAIIYVLSSVFVCLASVSAAIFVTQKLVS